MTASTPGSAGLQRWLGVLVALTALALFQLHLWPKRPNPPTPSQIPLPGTSLPSFPGSTTELGSVSPTLRRQLPQGKELRLANLESRHSSNLQVAALTSALPHLRLQQRRLVGDQIAVGQLQDRSALQTCIIGGRHAVTTAALSALRPHAIANVPLLVKGWLGFHPKSVSACLLVTLVQIQPSPQRTGLGSGSMEREFDEILHLF